MESTEEEEEQQQQQQHQTEEKNNRSNTNWQSIVQVFDLISSLIIYFFCERYH
jgi:hypothetical protein